MFSDLVHALIEFPFNPDQLTYWRHTYLPMSPWKRAIDDVVSGALEQAERYRLTGVRVDSRRAYQVARLVVADRDGSHLNAIVPDAYARFCPPSAATLHAGRRSYEPPAERLRALRSHPQVLAFLMTPTSLARRGIGGSPAGGLIVIEAGEENVDPGTVAERLRKRLEGGLDEAELHAFAELLVRLRVGAPRAAQEDGERREDAA